LEKELSSKRFNPFRTEVYFCHQNQNVKNIGNFTTLLKHHNIGTHLKDIETSFQVVPLFFKSFHFWASYITFWNFLKIRSVLKGWKTSRTWQWNMDTFSDVTKWPSDSLTLTALPFFKHSRNHKYSTAEHLSVKTSIKWWPTEE
jgi:hypothetical protein